jgi:tetratricopeptide (TPR) repeat protein
MPRRLLLLALLAVPALAVEPAARDQVNALIQRRQFAEAQSLLDQAVAATPGDAEAWSLLGRLAQQQGNAERAVEALEKATTLAPADSNLQRLLGDAYGFSAQKAGLFSKMGFAKKCKAAYDKAVELDPTNLDARWSVMEFCRQAPAMVGGGMDQAYAQAEEIRKLDANRGRIALATLYVAEKKMVEAFGLFDEALRASPDDYAALYQLGRLAAMTGQRLDEGLANLRKCLTLSVPAGQPGPAPVNWRIGNLLEKKGDKPAARAAYEAALAADPAFVPAIESLRKLKEG